MVLFLENKVYSATNKSVCPLWRYSPTPTGRLQGGPLARAPRSDWVLIAEVCWLHPVSTPTLLTSSELVRTVGSQEEIYTSLARLNTLIQKHGGTWAYLMDKSKDQPRAFYWGQPKLTPSAAPKLVHTWGTLRSISSERASGWWHSELYRVYSDSPILDKTPAGTEACQDRVWTLSTPALSRQTTNSVTRHPERSTFC